MRFWTYTLTSGSLTLNNADGALFISILTDAATGNCTVLGGIPFKGINSSPVTLANGEGLNFAALSPSFPLEGITITHVAGSIDIIVGF